MSYLFGVIILLVLLNAAQLWVNHKSAMRASEERSDLEAHLISLTNPQALLTKRATDPNAPGGDVDYVDEQREYEILHEGGANGSDET